MNQQQYINAEFTGNAYGNHEDVPDLIDPKEVDFRIVNTYGAPDGPLPHLITCKRAELIEKGRKMLTDMEANPPKSLQEGTRVPISTKDMPFLEKVMIKGKLFEPYDARDITEVVYRVMRDLMTTEASDRVANELHKEALSIDEKALQMEIADLWKDTNPIVGFLSRVRPPLRGPGLSGINDERFLVRVANESGMPPSTNAEEVVKAVFSATKDELSQERIAEIAQGLPGKIRELWEQAYNQQYPNI